MLTDRRPSWNMKTAHRPSRNTLTPTRRSMMATGFMTLAGPVRDRAKARPGCPLFDRHPAARASVSLHAAGPATGSGRRLGEGPQVVPRGQRRPAWIGRIFEVVSVTEAC